MSKSPFYLLGMTGGMMNLLGPTISTSQMADIKRKGAIQRASLQSGISAGQVDASNIQDFGYSKYGDIAAKGFENYQGDDNLYYSKRTGRTTSRDLNNPNSSTYVLGEGEELGKADSDSERRRRRGMVDLNAQVNQVVGSMPDASSSLVNPFGLETQNAIGGTFGSLFDRQNSMGSALAKRACKYKNKK
jgi:hypothetical protein